MLGILSPGMGGFAASFMRFLYQPGSADSGVVEQVCGALVTNGTAVAWRLVAPDHQILVSQPSEGTGNAVHLNAIAEGGAFVASPPRRSCACLSFAAVRMPSEDTSEFRNGMNF